MLCHAARLITPLQAPIACSRRSFLTSVLPNFSSPGNDQNKVYRQSKVLPYEQKDLYNVVADVASYRHFLPFCTGSRIVSGPVRQTRALGSQADLAPTVMEAELTVGFLAFKESYISRVTCTPHQSVQATASSSTPLFTSLQTTWRFEPANAARPDDKRTLVKFDLAYTFANPLYNSISSTFFAQVSQQMIEAFENRCKQVYG